MNAELNANIHTVLGLLIFGLIAKWYVWPKLKTMKLSNALTPLLLLSSFRYMGLLFIYPTVTADMPAAFAVPAAWGDFTVAMLALVAAILNRMDLRAGIILAWLYAILGSADFINAIILSNVNQVANHLGAVWPLFLIGGPVFIVTLGILFFALLKIKNE